MYNGHHFINIRSAMALQIANPVVVDKIERLASLTGMNKTAAVEVAVDNLLAEAQAAAARSSSAGRVAALLAQLDRIPDSAVPFDPLEWDEHGLPK
jgi:antitoxin VapB